MGRPAHQPTAETRAQVAALASFGTPQDRVAKFLGISSRTLRKHYRDLLDNSATAANMAVGKALFDQAVEGNVTAQIWWTKTRMGWSERVRVEVPTSLDDRAAAEFRAVLEVATPEERDDLRTALEQRRDAVDQAVRTLAARLQRRRKAAEA